MCRSGCPTQDCGYQCPTCQEIRDCDEWYFRQSGSSVGKRVYPCKPCSTKQRVAWNQANPERAAAALRKWRAERPRNAKEISLKSRYGITLDDFAGLLDSQGGVCAICKTPDPGTGGAFRVDHDHTCCPGKKSCGACVRGLLCNRCNVGIGMLGDQAETIRRAAEYVTR